MIVRILYNHFYLHLQVNPKCRQVEKETAVIYKKRLNPSVFARQTFACKSFNVYKAFLTSFMVPYTFLKSETKAMIYVTDTLF